MIDIGQGYFVALFFTQADYLKVLEGGPWMVMGHYLLVQKWRSNFVPSPEMINSTLIWIRLPRIPMKQFYEEALLDMGNVIGRAVRVESTGMDIVKRRFAQVCIEWDLHKPLVLVINVMGRRQEVEYEGLYKVCYKCGQFGHRTDQCSKRAGGDMLDHDETHVSEGRVEN